MGTNRMRGNLGPVKYGVYLRQKDEKNDKDKKINELKDMLFKDIKDPDFSVYKKKAQPHMISRRDISPLKDMFGIGAVSYHDEYVAPSTAEIYSVDKYNKTVVGDARRNLENRRLLYTEKVYNGEIIHTAERAKSLNDNIFGEVNWDKMKSRGSFFKPVVANDAKIQFKIEELKARPVVYRDNPDWDKYHGVMPDYPDPELAPWYPEMAGSSEASIFDNTADINIDSIIPNTNLDISKPAKKMENEIPTAVREDYYNKPDSEYDFGK